MQKTLFDVLIVGAGPGGATCAWKCAEAGLSVLLVDRAPSFPRYKPCGGGIPASLASHVDGLEPSEFADLTISKLRHSWKGKDPDPGRNDPVLGRAGRHLDGAASEI